MSEKTWMSVDSLTADDSVWPRYTSPSAPVHITDLGKPAKLVLDRLDMTRVNYTLTIPAYYALHWFVDAKDARCKLTCVCGSGLKVRRVRILCASCKKFNAHGPVPSAYYSPDENKHTLVQWFEAFMLASPHKDVLAATMLAHSVEELVTAINARLGKELHAIKLP